MGYIYSYLIIHHLLINFLSYTLKQLKICKQVQSTLRSNSRGESTEMVIHSMDQVAPWPTPSSLSMVAMRISMIPRNGLLILTEVKINKRIKIRNYICMTTVVQNMNLFLPGFITSYVRMLISKSILVIINNNYLLYNIV